MIKKLELKGEQKTIFTKLNRYLLTPNPQLQLIQGRAGCGKTFLVAALIEEISNRYKGRIAVASPTHKATRVLFNETETIHNKVAYGTIHSLLGLQQDINYKGELQFIKDYDNWNRLQKMKILFLDESSMLNDEIFNYLIEEQNRGLKIIFVGDQFQIPPINQLDALPFIEDVQSKYDIKVHTLTQILRQNKDNSIIQLGQHITNNLTNNDLNIENVLKGFLNLNNIFLLSKNDIDEQINLINKYFNSNEFKNNSDYIKIISWTNERVNMYNNIIRHIIYDKDVLPKLMINEEIILDCTIYSVDKHHKKVISLNTNEELKVVKYKIEKESFIKFNSEKEFYYYDTIVERKYDKELFNIKILHEDSQQDFNDTLNNLLNIAKNEHNKITAKNLWKNYYEFKNIYAQIKFNYCITAHKSQGSSYQNVIVDYTDIIKNGNIVERNRILYTSIARSRTDLFLII